MKEYTIYAGSRLNGFMNGQASVSFECESDDIDAAYDSLAENVVVKDPHKDLIDFEYCADDDVKTMLEDLKRMGFLSDFDEKEVKD